MELSSLKPGEWPYWAHAIRMGVTILLTMGCGAHAWATMRQQKGLPVSARFSLVLYAAALFFAAWANCVMMFVTLLAGRYQQGPYHLGTFTLLLVGAYVLTEGVRWRGGDG